MSRESLGPAPKGGLREKIKGIFTKKDSTSEASTSTSSALTHQASTSSRKSSPAVQPFSAQRLRALGPLNEPSARVRELEALSSNTGDRTLDVVSLWETTKDLLRPTVLSPRNDSELRGEVFKFFILLTNKQYYNLDIMRGILYHAIVDQYMLAISDKGNTEELAPIFEWLSALTNVGKNVSGFEEEIGDLLISWTEEFLLARPESPKIFIPDWLEFLANIFSTNSAFLEVDHAGPVVQYLCEFTGRTERNEESEGCLAVLDCLIGFSVFPQNQMFLLMSTLCRLANDQDLCQKCWKLMRSTFSSYMGYEAMNTLLKILQNVMDPGKLRGAVFFVGMGLWGSSKVSSLYYSPTAVLPSFKAALAVDSTIVTNEILISSERLIKKYGKDLQLVTWEHILSILDEILATSSMAEVDVRTRLHIVLDCIENLSDSNRFGGSADQLFTLVEKCSKQRSEESILRLLTYRAQAINPLRAGWIQDLRHLMTLYYRNDARASVRIKAVDILRNVYTLQKQLYGDELVEQVVIPLMSDLEKEKDSEVQGKALHFLCDIAKTLQQQGCGILSTIKTASSGEGAKNTTDFFFEIIGILERVINGSLDVVKKRNSSRVLAKRKSTMSTDGEESAPDFSLDEDADSEVSASLSERATEYLNNVEMGVDIIVEILKATWRGQASHVFHMLKVLASHVLLEYQNGINNSIAGATRHAILKLILKIRAHPVTYRLGHLFGEKQMQIEYSPYASVYDPFDPEDPEEENADQTSFFKWNLCAQVVITCLQKERFWPVLKDVFTHLPALLHNRILVLSTRNSIPALGSALLAMVDDPQRIQVLIGAPEHFHTSDLAELICPSLAALVTYKDCLQEPLQRKLVIGIQGALNSERSFEAVLATVSCILEMPTTVLPMTRDLVRRLAEIKMVARIAIPIVELLSTLLRLPKLYEQFSEKDFRNVLKSLTPCTRVAQYNSFIVAVAHHIIYRWMLKTPLNLRPSLAKHILAAIEESNSPLIGKKTSSDGKPANLTVEPSLTPSSSTETNSDYFANLAADLHILMSEFFHHFTYTNSPAEPGKTTILSELLAKEGWSKTWVVGNRIITVSTIINRHPAGHMGSGDVSNNCEIKFCPKCTDWLNNKFSTGSATSIRETDSSLNATQSSSIIEEDFSSKRRRHASAAQTRVTRRPSGASKISLDDSAISRVQRLGGSQDLRFNFATPSPNTPSSFQPKGGLPLCGCWCRGFATVEIQHAFGKTLWLTQISGTHLKEIDLGGNNGAIERWAMMRIQEGDYWNNLPSSPFFQSESAGGCALRTRHRSSSESPVPTRMSRNYSDGILGGDCQLRDPLEDLKETQGDESSWPTRTSSAAARSNSLHESRAEPDSRQDVSSPLTIDVTPKSHVDFADTPASSHSGSTYLSARSEALSRARAAANSEFGILAQDYSQVDPAWVFNQLCCQGFSENDRDVILLPETDKEAISRHLRILDKKPPFEMHKIGVVYAGLRQTSEVELLGNQFGSERYNRFLGGLGTLVSLARANQARTFLGGLDTNGKDGQFTYHWQDPITQVLFHVATLMPNHEKDPKFQQKKRHIGNDFVIIVYNESGVEYKLGTVSGQYAYVAIVVTPVDEDTVAVKLLAKDEISRWLSIKELVVSNQEAPLLCRQIAMRAEFSAVVWQSQSQRDPTDIPYISRYMERLKHIHKIRDKYMSAQ